MYKTKYYKTTFPLIFSFFSFLIWKYLTLKISLLDYHYHHPRPNETTKQHRPLFMPSTIVLVILREQFSTPPAAQLPSMLEEPKSTPNLSVQNEPKLHWSYWSTFPQYLCQISLEIILLSIIAMTTWSCQVSFFVKVTNSEEFYIHLNSSKIRKHCLNVLQ